MIPIKKNLTHQRKKNLHCISLIVFWRYIYIVFIWWKFTRNLLKEKIVSKCLFKKLHENYWIRQYFRKTVPFFDQIDEKVSNNKVKLVIKWASTSFFFIGIRKCMSRQTRTTTTQHSSVHKVLFVHYLNCSSKFSLWESLDLFEIEKEVKKSFIFSSIFERDNLWSQIDSLMQENLCKKLAFFSVKSLNFKNLDNPYKKTSKNALSEIFWFCVWFLAENFWIIFFTSKIL